MKFRPPPKEAEHLKALGHNAANYFGGKFKNTTSLHGTQWATFPDGEVVYFLRKTYWDERLGILYRVIVIDNLGRNEKYLTAIAQYKFDTPPIRNLATYGAPSGVMPMASKVFIYTNKLYSSIEEIRKIFALYQPNSFVEVVYKYDHMLLICSKESVLRCGVLNEIERMLEREASEGGTDTIIPVALDDYIFNEWSPKRVDIKQQVTSRVVSKINNENFDSEVEKILSALRR